MRRIVLHFAPAIFSLGVLAIALSARVNAQSDAAKLYKTNCVLCHAGDGSGNSPSGKALGAKDLGSAEVRKKTDAEIAESITKGKGKMPAMGAKLKPEEIKQLVDYIRALPKK